MTRLINFVAGFIVGVALGGAIAVFLAPQAGSETQRCLRGRLEAILEEARQSAETTRTEAHARLSDLKAR
jgi:gas vesicle protein